MRLYINRYIRQWINLSHHDEEGLFNLLMEGWQWIVDDGFFYGLADSQIPILNFQFEKDNGQ